MSTKQSFYKKYKIIIWIVSIIVSLAILSKINRDLFIIICLSSLGFAFSYAPLSFMSQKTQKLMKNNKNYFLKNTNDKSTIYTSYYIKYILSGILLFYSIKEWRFQSMAFGPLASFNFTIMIVFAIPVILIVFKIIDVIIARKIQKKIKVK